MTRQINAKVPGFVGEFLFIGIPDAVEDRREDGGMQQLQERGVHFEMTPDVEDSIGGCIDCIGNYLVGEQWLKDASFDYTELQLIYADCTLFGIRYVFDIRVHLEWDKEHGHCVRYSFEPCKPTRQWEDN